MGLPSQELRVKMRLKDYVVNRAVAFVGRLVVAGGLVFSQPAWAAIGAAAPWVTYEAESMTLSGGTILGPSYSPNVVQSESSGRRCVRLGSTGAYVEFTAQSAANALVVRYSVPDSAGGGGTDYTLSLYRNGALIAKLPVTSKYSWLYGGYPFSNTPGSGPRNFFDEVRTNNLSIGNGDVLRLQKDASDTASFYDIDLVDLENVAAPLSQPGGSASIKNAPYNAVGNGVADDTAALQNCINANNSVWVPPGNYKITGSINLPSNRAIRGAGSWHSTFVGDASLYSNSARRVTLNGNGSNIQLSDLAIVGKLNYRNDSEANDGLGGSYGTGSTISRLWVEHTKTGAWIVNSLGLVVDSCRFRNTIADGINLVVGMRNSLVTNCTTRGTGDDCFAIWPATYLAPVYAPGLNVITHCTGQVPFLANGAAVYGGQSNRIEDCLFQDMTYGCGILLSTTFSVSTNFSGTTVVQRCDLNRCGGYDPGLGWRAAVQLCLQNAGINGVNLNNLNITNSASDGLSVIYGAGALSNAIMSNVSIPNYGLGTSGRHGLWARNDTVGSMTVSNSTVVEYADDSPTFTFNFVTSTIPVTVQSNPSGRTFNVDGTSYTNTQGFSWLAGSSHTIATTASQSGGTGVQYLWSSWSDGAGLSHTVTPGTASNYTASFTTQYFLTMSAGAGGSVSPANGWYDSGTNVNISATASNEYSFGGWIGSGTGAYSGSNNPASITLNSPLTQSASFEVVTNIGPPSQSILGITIGDSITLTYATTPGFPYHIETTTNLAPAIWTTIPDSITNATDTSATFTFPSFSDLLPRFYRTVSP